MNDTTTQSGDYLLTLTPLEARYKAALEEIRERVVEQSTGLSVRQNHWQWAVDIANKALDESTFAP